LAVAFSPDGSRIASGGHDDTLKVWDARTGQDLLTLKGHTASVLSVAVSTDGSRIASGSQDNTLKVWDARTGQDLLTLQGHTDSVTSVAFSPDGSRIASGSTDRTLRVWDARNGPDLLTLEGHTSSVSAVDVSPDGSRLVSGSSDNTSKVWDAQTGLALLTLKGHTAGVNAVAYSPDGSRVVSGSSDRTVKVWDAQTGQDLLTLRGHATLVSSVAFSPDGSRVFGAYANGAILAWDARSGTRLADPPKTMTTGRRFVARGDRCAYADGGLVRVERLRSPDEWQRYRLDEGRVQAILGARHDRDFHLAGLRKRLDPFGAVFHLDRLLALSPGDRPVVLKRRTAVLSAALAKDAADHHSARCLARQAVASPDTIPDAKALLPLIAHHQHAALDRLHGTLLLRTGDARAAALVFRAAIRNRTNKDEPPIDELLLALALVKLDRHDEARDLLAKASAWIDDGTAPQRLASLLGARPAGPLASLTALAHVPDPRLNSLDPFTAHELHALRREAEAALAGR
jgi:hypothetical protein